MHVNTNKVWFDSENFKIVGVSAAIFIKFEIPKFSLESVELYEMSLMLTILYGTNTLVYNHEREFPIPGILGNTGLQFSSRKSGMEFATRIPIPENGNGIFHLHSRSRKWE